MDISWLLFLTASIALIATPGPDMILVMSRSVTQGPAAGVVTALGVSTGLVAHTALATLGLGIVLKTSNWLFFTLKVIGAAYLVYLGVRAIVSANDDLTLLRGDARPLRRLYLDGAVCNIANPKIAVFYLAFLPQFVTPGGENPTVSILMLGVTFAALTFLIKGPLAIFSGRLSHWFRRRPAALSWLYRSSGAVLIGLGIRLALERRAA
jgi:threonine/homoserine/homoserine lactone efflux protein